VDVASICLGPLATNCYLVESGGRAILVDPPEDSGALQAFVGHRTIDWIVNTHGHPDHTAGNEAFPDVPVRIHRDDVQFLDADHPRHPPLGPLLEEGDEILEGWVVLHTPGHSRGSVVLKGPGALIVGDLLFAGSIGRTDLPGGSMREIVQSLKRLVRLPGDYVVYPGHGETTTLDRERRRNPFLIGLE
jgi:hydroxyacylglutathione hydrolase